MWESTHITTKEKIYDEARLFFSSEVINCSTALISLNSCNTCKLESTWYLIKIFFSAFLFRGYHSQWVLLDAWLVRFMFQWCFTAISSLWSSQSFRYVLHQCNAWLGYICLNCAILRRTLVLVHFVFFFPITARLEHAAYLNNESMLSWFKGDSHLFYFFHIYFFCLLYLLTFEQYNVMICCCLYGLQKCNTSSFSCIFHFLDSLSSLYLTQVLALAYYTISYFPGGSSGLKFISSSLLSSVTSCFGR